jgi:hypothetical protein
MQQYKVWFRKACGDTLLMRTAERFYDRQLLRRHFSRILVRDLNETFKTSFGRLPGAIVAFTVWVLCPW